MKRSAVILILTAILTQMLWAGMAAGTWTCEFCQKTNDRRFCTSCGRSMEEATNKEAAACFHGNHDYRPATCTEPQTCNRCGATQGDALGHEWLPATREQPETCSRCGMTRGEKLSNYNVGDIYTFGHYEQDNNLANGPEPIEWIVIDKQDDGSLVLLSKYALDSKPYNKEDTSVTWETCTLRKWLNEDFFNAAFSAEEQAKIVPVMLKNENNPSYRTKGGNATQDRVWLLSINGVTNEYSKDKVYSYFTNDASRMCAPTNYALAQGAWSNSYTGGVGTCRWWLRSPGSASGFAALVFGDGLVDYDGADVDRDDFNVRPVVFVQPSAENHKTAKATIAAIESKETYEVGSSFVFGSYEQDNNLANGQEPIEWIVIDKRDDGSLVLLSKYSLDAKPYNLNQVNVTWETCTLRKWLNEDFYNAAFSADEQAKIVPVTLENEDNPEYGTKGGNDTIDKVWLLSINEATTEFTGDKVYRYFTDNDSRMCAPTKYAVAQGAYQVSDYTVDGVGVCWWWLRSSGYESCRAAVVDYNGWVDYNFNYVDINQCSVRPVLVVLPPAENNETAKAATAAIEPKETYETGSSFVFGSYEQDNNTANGKEPIEWIVLDTREDGSLVLLSKYALDCKPYNTEFPDVTWETCTLRAWLNEDFYNAAFSAQEQAKIVPVTLENEDNPYWGTTGGKATTDKVWLLSINEVTNNFTGDKVYSYFADDDTRICYPTAYAVAQGAYTYNNACWWWLRSPGCISGDAAFVDRGGSVDISGDYVINVSYCVRPVVVVLP